VGTGAGCGVSQVHYKSAAGGVDGAFDAAAPLRAHPRYYARPYSCDRWVPYVFRTPTHGLPKLRRPARGVVNVNTGTVRRIKDRDRDAARHSG
jgi:hypothetical protein